MADFFFISCIKNIPSNSLYWKGFTCSQPDSEESLGFDPAISGFTFRDWARACILARRLTLQMYDTFYGLHNYCPLHVPLFNFYGYQPLINWAFVRAWNAQPFGWIPPFFIFFQPFSNLISSFSSFLCPLKCSYKT